CGTSKPAETNDAATGGSSGSGGAGGTGGSTDGGATDGPTDVVLGPPQKLVILHTNDIHSHLEGFGPEADYSPATLNDDTTVGGMARLATAIGTARAQAGDTVPVLLLDAGDFMMGTLFELLATVAPPELAMMSALKYDATTIGNHELDWTPTGLAGLLGAAAKAKTTIPIIASNMHFSDTDPGDDALKMLADGGAIQSKMVKTYGTLKVGFFGLLGADAVQVTPQAAPLTFDPIATAATAMVADLRNNDKVDLVVALSHSGITSVGTGEDFDLANTVPGIDIIISGHTHDKLDQPKIVKNTVIVTAGAYGQYLGKLEVTVTPGATPQVAVDKYTLIHIDDTIMGDGPTEIGVQTAIAGVDMALAQVNPALTYKAPIAETGADLALPMYAEAPIGNLVTDAYRKITAAVQPTAPPMIAVEANGQLRAPILKGNTGQVWFEDMFRVLPIGIGPDQLPGYPLVTFYLNAADIKSGLELDAAAGFLSDQYFLQVSGISATYDSTKPVFGRVTGLSLVDDSNPASPVVTPLDITDTTKCYKVVATNYVAGLLGLIQKLTSGLLSVTAKAADCSTKIDPTQAQYYVDAAPDDPNVPATTGVQELKHWQALLKYMTAFPDTSVPANGIKDVPAAYATAQGRIVGK
ncbi:MAG TPA: bifunctional metallophosphatase/5'-nucleotidase, partial [Polyangia bacterium]